MALQKHFRIALVGLGLFAASLAGHAQSQPENVERLLNAPIAGQEQSLASPLAILGKRAMDASLSNDEMALLAPALKVTSPSLKATIDRIVPLLKVHLNETEQEHAMLHVLSSVLGDTQQAKMSLDALPKDNIVAATLSRIAQHHQLLGGTPHLASFDVSFRLVPNFNVQDTVSAPGVATLQSILQNPCAKVQTSLALQEANTQCAMKNGVGDGTKTVVTALEKNKANDGLLVGEYRGIPVLVMHDASKAHHSAAVFQLKQEEGTKAEPFVVFSLALLNKLAQHPDTINFILEHELGHVAHNHTMSGQNHHEIEADNYAFNALMEKGMTPQRIANAYYTFEQVMGPGISQSKLQSVQFAQMMESRHQNVANNSQQPKRDFPAFKLDLGHAS